MAILAIVLAGLCATSVDISFALPGRPDLLVALVVFCSTRRDAMTSCVVAGILGIVGDAASGARLGVGAMWLTMIAFAVSTISFRERSSSPLTCIAVSMVASIAAVVGLSVIHAVSGVVDLPAIELVERCALAAFTTSVIVVSATLLSWLIPSVRHRHAV
jgi:rod shape-determining protein MreD